MTSWIAESIFIFSLIALIYIYLGYPLLVYLVSRIRPRPVKRGPVEPPVTILITAYNEERDIRQKLENTLRIDYPSEKLEILAASDGSTDRTDEIVKEFAGRGVRLFRQEGRVGKTATQNNAVALAAGEIILFSDATTAYPENVLREILPAFADESVGCVAGKLIYVDRNRTTIGQGAKSYWNYETFLKEAESRACSLIGASGCLYAVRRAAYRPMYPEACSDFLIATVLYEQGLRTIYEPNAVCTEETNNKSDKELRMRVRVISQTFTDLWRNRRMMNPWRSGFYSIELISHKLLRYTVPLFLILLLLTSAYRAPASVIFQLFFVAQTGFYLAALLAWFVERSGGRLGLLAMPLYFSLANLASLIGFYKFLCGERYARWEPIRETVRPERQPEG
jgi:cellulose synthase/poly-beta-1,6-N-acetylglucosamine synthase-like glycosyltransferase